MPCACRGIGVRTRQRHLAARVNGFADQPSLACTGCPHAPRRGIGVRTRQRHLAAAPGSGPCRRFALSSDVRSEGAGLPPCRGVVKAGARSPRPCDGEGAGIFPQKSGKMRKADAVRRVPGLLALLALLPFKSLPQSQAGCFSAMPKNTLRPHRHVAGLGAGGKAPGPRRHSPVIFAYGVLQRERGGDILSGKTERVDDGFSA